MQRAAHVSPVTDLGAHEAGIADTAEALAPAEQPRSTESTAAASHSHVAVARSGDTIDSLSRLSSRELDAKFRDASVALADLAALDGHPHGRVLAVPAFARLERGIVGQWLRRYHASRFYPWEGKSFYTRDQSAVRGVNRVRYPSRRAILPFRVSLTSSVVDERPSIAIDYDMPGNPKIARVMYDELRALGDGLFLGRGMSRRANGAPGLVLWFVLDTCRQDAALT